MFYRLYFTVLGTNLATTKSYTYVDFQKAYETSGV